MSLIMDCKKDIKGNEMKFICNIMDGKEKIGTLTYSKKNTPSQKSKSVEFSSNIRGGFQSYSSSFSSGTTKKEQYEIQKKFDDLIAKRNEINKQISEMYKEIEKDLYFPLFFTF